MLAFIRASLSVLSFSTIFYHRQSGKSSFLCNIAQIFKNLLHFAIICDMIYFATKIIVLKKIPKKGRLSMLEGRGFQHEG